MNRTAALLLAVGILAACSSFKRCSYEGSSRTSWQQPERVIAALGIRPGDRVADLGSGSGYFTLRLAPAVGPDGQGLRGRRRRGDERTPPAARGAGGLGQRGRDPRPLRGSSAPRRRRRPRAHRRHLPPPRGSPGLLPQPAARSRSRRAHRGYRLRRAERLVRAFMGHTTPREELLREMAEAGYEVAQEFDFIDRQSFVIFRCGLLELRSEGAGGRPASSGRAGALLQRRERDRQAVARLRDRRLLHRHRVAVRHAPAVARTIWCMTSFTCASAKRRPMHMCGPPPKGTQSACGARARRARA